MSFGDDGLPAESGGYGGTGQTRTRLPEGEGDVYGGARRSARPSRSLLTVVSVVVLLIAAIAFANRGGSDDDSPSSDDGTKPGSGSTAASGVEPVKDGFAHDRQGAQSAAANYAVSLVSAEILQSDQRPEIVKRVFVADKVSELEAKFDKAYSTDFLGKIGLDEKGKAASGQTYISRTAPIGTKVKNYSADSATVEVWCTGVFGTAGEGSQNPVTSDWFTMTLKLQWTGKDWQVETFSQKEGPAPVNGDNKVSSADAISKAVEEFGGFTYAR
ncbi:hypothetical protein [Streptomyces sp. NBC_01304]|uniref:hypothetical protein n=1 Tax=Streptomyces sp. NBC_01304 TaxID=2903818 RepID=UPI002E0E15F3|nr:hypothetical protein OG430_26535 [Streptomyces sp. NBC_01304]